MPASPQRYHEYYAEAVALSGSLRLPLTQEVCPPTFVKLNERGGYLSQHAENYRLGGAVSFRSAYTQVAGNRSLKPGHGWTTLATSVVEGFNALEVVTADRIVSQISTSYPLDGYVPTVTFLGTRFETFPELETFCRQVAGSIGRLCLAIFDGDTTSGSSNGLAPAGSRNGAAQLAVEVDQVPGRCR